MSLLSSSVKIGVIFLCLELLLNQQQPMQYLILLPTDELKQSLLFSAFKHFDCLSVWIFL